MSPRTGRPKSNNPKCVDIKVRIDEDINKKLLEYCKMNNLTRAAAIRKGIEEILNN